MQSRLLHLSVVYLVTIPGFVHGQMQQPPHPVRAIAVEPKSAEQSAAEELLRKKLVERDRLQREIADLRESSQTFESILVNVKMLEVNLTKLRQLGTDVSTADGERFDIQSGDTTEVLSDKLSRVPAPFFDTLANRGIAKILASPMIATTSGRPASFNVGGEVPIPTPDGKGVAKLQKYGTRLDILAESLGDNKVRLHVRPRVSKLDTARSILVDGKYVPAITVRECDTICELESGKSAVISGLVQTRHEATIDTAGRTHDEVIEVALVVVMTPEIVR